MKYSDLTEGGKDEFHDKLIQHNDAIREGLRSLKKRPSVNLDEGFRQWRQAFRSFLEAIKSDIEVEAAYEAWTGHDIHTVDVTAVSKGAYRIALAFRTAVKWKADSQLAHPVS